MTNRPQNPKQSLTIILCLAALVAPAAAGEGENQQTAPASNTPSAIEQAGTWLRLLQAVPKAGIPLEGLIKPETMGIDSQVEASDNVVNMLSGNRTRMFNGNSATGKISILSGIKFHLHITIQSPADDTSADAGGSVRSKAHSRKSARQRRKASRSADKDRSGARTKGKRRARGRTRKSE